MKYGLVIYQYIIIYPIFTISWWCQYDIPVNDLFHTPQLCGSDLLIITSWSISPGKPSEMWMIGISPSLSKWYSISTPLPFLCIRIILAYKSSPAWAATSEKFILSTYRYDLSWSKQHVSWWHSACQEDGAMTSRSAPSTSRAPPKEGIFEWVIFTDTGLNDVPKICDCDLLMFIMYIYIYGIIIIWYIYIIYYILYIIYTII